MTKYLRSLVTVGLLIPTLLSTSFGSLFGPWRRYQSNDLGFEVPFVDDWQITPLKNCVVFAMQLNPDPYVRLAVGRIKATSDDFEHSVQAQLTRLQETRLNQTRTRLGGLPAIRVEGVTANGRILDYYVDKGPYRYWISFIADRPELWEQYRQSFELILQDFRFVEARPQADLSKQLSYGRDERPTRVQ